MCATFCSGFSFVNLVARDFSCWYFCLFEFSKQTTTQRPNDWNRGNLSGVLSDCFAFIMETTFQDDIFRHSNVCRLWRCWQCAALHPIFAYWALNFSTSPHSGNDKWWQRFAAYPPCKQNFVWRWKLHTSQNIWTFIRNSQHATVYSQRLYISVFLM